MIALSIVRSLSPRKLYIIFEVKNFYIILEVKTSDNWKDIRLLFQFLEGIDFENYMQGDAQRCLKK